MTAFGSMSEQRRNARAFLAAMLGINVVWHFVWPTIAMALFKSSLVQMAVFGLLTPVLSSLFVAWIFGILRKKSIRTVLVIFAFCFIAPVSVDAAFDLFAVHKTQFVQIESAR